MQHFMLHTRPHFASEGFLPSPLNQGRLHAVQALRIALRASKGTYALDLALPIVWGLVSGGGVWGLTPTGLVDHDSCKIGSTRTAQLAFSVVILKIPSRIPF